MSIFEKWKQGLQWMKIQDGIGEPPWEYNFLYNLPKSEYPKYLAKIFNYRTGEKLPLKWDFKTKNWIIDKNKCKTFNQKIQWLKLYGVTDLMRDCTDKVKVRDYVRERIREEYLKPVLQIIPNEEQQSTDVIANVTTSNTGNVWQSRKNTELDEIATEPKTPSFHSNDMEQKFRDCHGSQNAVEPRNDGKFDLLQSNLNDVSTYFDQINWDKLPNSFVIKTNHGCKWQYIIKDKEQFLNTPQLFETVKRNMTGWLEQDYSIWGGFEMQYKGIKSKILIEPLMSDDVNKFPQEIHIYCFNRKPKYIIKLHNENEITVYDEKFNVIDNLFSFKDKRINLEVDDLINQTFVLSKQLSKDFKFARIDWMIYKNKIYFEEMTFTPYSGFCNFKNKQDNVKLAKFINI